MKNYIEFIIGIFLLAALMGYSFYPQDSSKSASASGEEGFMTWHERSRPTDWFMNQRMYPYNTFNFEAFKEGRRVAHEMRQNQNTRNEWEFVGCTNIGGRVCDVEWDPQDQNVAYMAAASGGIFKTTDQGKTWFPIFDNQECLNMGDIAVAPSNPNIIYVGTGEVNPGGGSITYPGKGVYKSEDAGKTWKNVGLEETQLIGRVKVHPTNPDIVYVAATGRLYGKNKERGVFKSTDGGKTWDHVFFLSEKTGAIDLSLNAKDPNIVYAAMWQRERRPGFQKYHGPESGIHRSKDGGKTWEKLTGGLPGGELGRIGIDICDSEPNVLYACIADTRGGHKGVYKTTNGGDSWSATPGGGSLNVATYAWWFSNIRVDPNDPDNVFFMGFTAYRSTNGGSSFSSLSGMHVDHHATAIHPKNSNLVLEGNDGGVYYSTNGGSTFTKPRVLPISQFYSLDVASNDAKKMLGGLQDNGVVYTGTGSTNDWRGVIGGDGLDVAFDPTNNQYAYGESQDGAFQRSSNGGASFTSGGGASGNKGWKCPIVCDPTNGDVYFGTDRVNRSTNHGQSFTAVSPVLTTNARPAESERARFPTVTCIAASKANNKYIYAGTDNGNLWVTKDHGSNWTKISDELPNHWFTSIAIDPKDPEIVYVTISGYRYNTSVPHVFKSTDAGKTWKAIASNLPEVPANHIVVDPTKPGMLYLATDMGVYVSNNDGGKWWSLGFGLPSVVVHELCLHEKTNTLYAGTFGRGIYKVGISEVNIEKNIAVPQMKINLHNYPNPVKLSTNIQFSLERHSDVSLDIYAMNGKKIYSLQRKAYTPGTHSIKWNRVDNSGKAVAAGNYIYKIQMGKKVYQKTLTVVQ